MAIRKVKISALPVSQIIGGLSTIAVDADGRSVKVGFDTLKEDIKSDVIKTYTLDLTDIGDGSYFNIGERGFTPALINALQKDAPKNFTLCVKQGLNTAQCPYGGFFLPEGQEGGNVYIISLNYQQPQCIHLLQYKNKIKVFIEDILTEADFKYATPVEIDSIINSLS